MKRFMSTGRAAASVLVSPPKTPVAPTRSCSFHCLIWLAWTLNCWDNSTNVCSPRMAVSATFARLGRFRRLTKGWETSIKKLNGADLDSPYPNPDQAPFKILLCMTDS